MPSPRPGAGRGARAGVAGALLCTALVAGAAGGHEGPAATPRAASREIGGIRVDVGSFWYPCTPPAGEGNAAPAGGCGERVLAALETVLREYPETFPRPMPVVTVVRAVAREHVDRGATWSSALGAYGCATLERGVVVVEIGPGAFTGRDALNDAELRSLLAHELLHAHQYVRGEHGGRAREIARRELEALDWELAHLEPEVRPAYRADLEFNRKMFAAMLE
jgi:hypothetical protein